jgi:hypothetical protein
MNVNEVAKTMTREDFLIEIDEHCPKEFGLNNNKCAQFVDCIKCREDSVKDVLFKGEENEINNYKWVFNIEEYNNKDIVINCEKEDEADKLFEILKDYDLPKCKQLHDAKTCYRFDKKTGVYQDNYKYYKESGYDIYRFSDIDFDNLYTNETINIKEEYYKLQKQLDSIKDIFNVKQEQWENEQGEEIHKLKERINNYQDSILKRQDEMENLKRDNKILKEMTESQNNIIEEQNEEIHNLDSIIKDLQTEKKTLKTQAESDNNRCESIAKLNQQFRQIIKQFSEML